jgi:heme exporter protein A
MLQATNLTLWRGDTCLFERLSLLIEPGMALVIRGPNGAGKTTLLRVLCGLSRPEEGEILWQGKPASSALRGQVAYSGHHPGLKVDLTVRQNLRFYARLGPVADRCEEVLARLEIERCADLEVRHLSAGQKRRTALARILLSGAPLWLLDEPFSNMDTAGRLFFEKQIERHGRDGGLAAIVVHECLQLHDVATRTLELSGG